MLAQCSSTASGGPMALVQYCSALKESFVCITVLRRCPDSCLWATGATVVPGLLDTTHPLLMLAVCKTVRARDALLTSILHEGPAACEIQMVD